MVQYIKSAAPVDEKQLQALGITPGAAAHFDVNEAEKAYEGVLKGTGTSDALGAYGISKNIKRLQGADQHHTGMLLGIDNEGKGPMMLHNYTEGDAGTRVEPLRNFLNATNVETTLPSSTTKAEQLLAAAHGLKNHETAVATGARGYPQKNLTLAGTNAIVQRLPLSQQLKERISGWLNSKAVICPPGEDICSKMLPDAYAGALGKERAAATFGVTDVARQGNIGFSPKSVRAAPGTISIGKYTVKETPAFEKLLGAVRAGRFTR